MSMSNERKELLKAVLLTGLGCLFVYGYYALYVLQQEITAPCSKSEMLLVLMYFWGAFFSVLSAIGCFRAEFSRFRMGIKTKQEEATKS